MAELSEICHQVVVIEQGKLCGEGNIRSMQDAVNSEQSKLWMTCLSDPEMVAVFLEQQEDVASVEVEDGYIYFDFLGDLEKQSQLLNQLCQQGFKPIRFSEREVDLEDVFLKLTKT